MITDLFGIPFHCETSWTGKQFNSNQYIFVTPSLDMGLLVTKTKEKSIGNRLMKFFLFAILEISHKLVSSSSMFLGRGGGHNFLS